MMHIKYRDVSMYFMVAAFVPTFYLGVASFRSYHYSIEILRKQLQNFRLAETKCNCCTVGHVAPDGSSMSCDRKVVEQCICNWFGSIEEFEVFIVPLLRRTFENELGQHTFPYVYFLVVFCPVIWTGMDLSLGHRWGHWWMFQLTGFWLGIMPSVAKVGLYLSSFFCRPLPCRVCDMLLNLVIVLVLNLIWAAAIFIAAILNPKNPHRMKVAWVDELPKDMTIRAFLVLVAFCIPAVVLFFVPTVIRAVCSRLARLTRNSVQPSQLQVPKNGP
ncbi:unnamed protein product [Symbiodinium sp. KB8]|nr:unnamed protein product [Symbiodinium sp. KB8]